MAKKIAIVGGSSLDQKMVSTLVTANDFDFSLYQLGQQVGTKPGIGIATRIFEELPDMPGYMRNLEDEIADADVIVALEINSLSTFQAVRIARKTNRPIAVMVNNFQPLMALEYPNVRAMQSDILGNSDRFFAASAQVKSSLKLEGVPEEKIEVFRPRCDVEHYAPDQGLREKFRGYVKVGPDEILALYHHDLDDQENVASFLNAMRMIRQQNAPRSHRLRLLVAGEGGSASVLKYLAWDMGLGQSIMFLHQDVSPFFRDLACATDLLFVPWASRHDPGGPAATRSLDIVSCGALPIVPRPSPACEYFSELGVSYVDQSFEQVGEALTQALIKLGGKDVREQCHKFVVNHFGSTSIDLKPLTELAEACQEQGVDYKQRLVDIEQLVARNEWRKALVEIEELMLHDIPLPEIQSTLLRLKGDGLSAANEFEEATETYHKSLEVHPENGLSYRGLGFIALKSHSHDEALTFFKKSLATSKDDPPTLLGIGLVYRRIGLPEEALFWLEKCVGLDGQSRKSGIVALSQACLECPSPRLAAQTLERVIDAIGETPALNMTLGQVYLRDGNVQGGRELLRKAIE